MKVKLYLWIVTIVVLQRSLGYYHHSNHLSNRIYHGNDVNNCPLQCRCIKLSHLGSREMAHRWRSFEPFQGREAYAWRATQPPVSIENRYKIPGRDMVCMALGDVPWPLSKGLYVTIRKKMGHVMRQPHLCHMRTTKVQLSLRIRAV